MKNYFRNLFSSFFDLQTYRRFIQGKTNQAVWHFVISMLLVGLVISWQFYTRAIPFIKEAVISNLDYLVTNFPSDLVINWDGTQLTTEPEQYHFLALHPEKLPLFDSLEQSFPDPLLIYTNTKLTLDDADELLTQSHSAMIIDQNSVFTITDDQNGLKRLALSEYFNDSQLMIDQANLPQLRQTTQNGILKLLDLTAKLILPLILVGLLLARLFTSLILATLLWIPARLGKVIDTWQESWRFTLVLLVVVEVIHWISLAIYPNLNFPVYTIAFWVLSLFILLALNSQVKTPAKTLTKSKRK
ncbi:MAG: hypothetical protein ABII10_02235 [Candidatus Paceibacterota bacterium]